MPPGTWSPTGSIRADGRDDVEPVPTGPGDHARGLWRAFPSASATQAAGPSRLYWRTRKERLANKDVTRNGPGMRQHLRAPTKGDLDRYGQLSRQTLAMPLEHGYRLYPHRRVQISRPNR